MIGTVKQQDITGNSICEYLWRHMASQGHGDVLYLPGVSPAHLC